MTLSPPRETSPRSALEERLDDPSVAASLVTLLDHADLVALMVEGLDGLIARSEVIGDNLLSGLTEIRSAADSQASSLDLGALMDAGKHLATSLPKAAPALERLGEIATPETLEQLALLTAGMARGSAEFASRPVEVGGALSLLRLLKDPDINRAISFFATIARSIGQELAAAPAPSGSAAGQPAHGRPAPEPTTA